MAAKPEHRLSHHCMELCDRIVVRDGPCWWTAVDTGSMIGYGKANEKSDLIRIAMENSKRYQGIKPHAMDVWIYQKPWLVMIELKIASSYTAARLKLSSGQLSTMVALDRDGIPNAVAWSIPSFYDALCRFQLRLHRNAGNIAIQVAEEYAAAVRASEIEKPKRKRAPPKAEPRFTMSAAGVKRARSKGILI